ncbi:MAG: hypothetical protein S4CHLAM20_11960 [Chlamydiia bacterium]|nr:hypothetical protein [Chlamydiia bacterium]
MIKRLILPEVEELHRLFRYDSETGKLYWKISRTSSIKVGDEAGYLMESGYMQVHIKNKDYRLHRVVYKMCHKVEPPDYIDHINEIKTDNRIENLREIDNAHNLRRSLKGSGVRNPSGREKKYRARPYFNGKSYGLGGFDTYEEARQKVVDWEQENGVRRD